MKGATCATRDERTGIERTGMLALCAGLLALFGCIAHLVDARDVRGRAAAKDGASFAQDEREPSSHRVGWRKRSRRRLCKNHAKTGEQMRTFALEVIKATNELGHERRNEPENVKLRPHV